ncbi:MAG: phosphatidate cytidylyltransferase [Firmicutes bacterium]|nr:phosphatidate cytidylyltransferase [Bacillota bacterium]
MAARIITAVVGVPAIVLLAHQGGWLFFVLVLGLAEAGLFEYYRLTKVPYLLCTWGYIIAAIFLISIHTQGLQCSWLLFNVGIIGLLLVVLFNFPDYTFQQAGTALLGVCYIPFLFAYLLLLRALPQGGQVTILAFVLTWVVDSAAFLIGSCLGHRPLAPKLSPRKTWEGAWAGLSGSLIVMFWMAPRIDLSWLEAIIIGVAVAVAAMMGDLLESALKRLAKVKDAGRILPGHGGILDRFDALLVVAPTLYFFLELLWRKGR